MCFVCNKDNLTLGKIISGIIQDVMYIRKWEKASLASLQIDHTSVKETVIVLKKREREIEIAREGKRGRENLERSYREIKTEYECQKLCLKDGD